MLVVQDPARPDGVIDAIASLGSAGSQRLRVLSAYTTKGGCELLFERLAAAIGPTWGAIPKTVITSFDYGITEPDALTYLQSQGVEVRIANVGAGGRLVLFPSASAFHPKAYIVDDVASIGAVIGSANLTRRALRVNVEAVFVANPLPDTQGVEAQWQATVSASQELDPVLLAAYAVARPAALEHARPPKEPLAPLGPPQPVGTLKTFAEAVADGDVDPATFAGFWIEAGSMSSSGSHAQLELPRRGSTFFGYQFTQYDDAHHTLGHPPLSVLGTWFYDRPLTWHGNNRMERLNLPTKPQSGLEYPWTYILFRRVVDGFTVTVGQAGGHQARAWENEASASGHLYRLGAVSDRRCGLI